MHPIHLLIEWLPDADFAVLDHGLVPHGRDYVFLVETSLGPDPGRHKVQFTHVTEMTYATAVVDDVWQRSWREMFVDYQAWLEANQPDGYVWGTCWSLAFPGLRALEPSQKAAQWSERLAQPMWEAEIETDRFRLNLVFHSIRWAKVSDDVSTVAQVVIPQSE